MKGYFHRVQEQSPTKFWINNVTREEAALAIAAGARGCTQNPSYVYKMLTHPTEKDFAFAALDRILPAQSDDDEVLVQLQRELVGNIAKIFAPMYEASKGKAGYVSIQGDPFKEDTDTIVKHALYNREAGANIMAKVPVTKEGLEAIEFLAAKGVPINATEVMAVRQALDVCEVYMKATKDLKDPAPIYYSHITGIYDEYLAKHAAAEGIDVSKDALWQAGMAIAKKVYWMVNEKQYPVGFIGGGARGLHHFTEMVGADACVTINWVGTAEVLLREDPPVVQRFYMPTPYSVVDELVEKVEDFRKGYFVNAIEPEEYEHFGPVVLFRNSFEDAWAKARQIVKERRAALG